eukprot:CAMPEP_0172714898 /NCGR_PEP_ID=MMETSP1074-20121228/67221_1 /TAXON_ID=2916 /ORGANISM="Ceratium fusus, Strain PA161109" /LENGTH=369 /DNA_ID=CAMNT_0013539421 /DNA_START=327 /DNA_END=1436 /DNA_ORIENTATION=+
MAVDQLYQWLPIPKTAPGPSPVWVEEERRQRCLLVKYSDADNDLAMEKKRKIEVKLREFDDYFKRTYADLDRYPVPDYLVDDYGKGNINMAVTGASGVGKSSFINAIRRVKASDSSAAKTGVVETTMAPARFDFPTEQGFFSRMSEKVKSILNPSDDPIQPGDVLLLNGRQVRVQQKSTTGRRLTVEEIESGQTREVESSQVTGKLSDCMIWDLPGTGTPAFPQATYIRSMGIRHFDLVVLLTATRFTEAEMMLMQELKRWRVPFFLVRTKIDSDVQAEIELREECQQEECEADECLEIEDDTVAVIKNYFASLYDENVYCISSKPSYRNKYDFLTLEADMEEKIKKQRLFLRSELSESYSSSWWNPFR